MQMVRLNSTKQLILFAIILIRHSYKSPDLWGIKSFENYSILTRINTVLDFDWSHCRQDFLFFFFFFILINTKVCLPVDVSTNSLNPSSGLNFIKIKKNDKTAESNQDALLIQRW